MAKMEGSLSDLVAPQKVAAIPIRLHLEDRLGCCEIAVDLNDAINKYKSMSGMAIKATICQMDWKWLLEDSRQNNARGLLETGNT